MEQIRTLRRRVKAIWKQEEDLPPQIRKLFQWQMLAYQNGVPYLVGKGDANTFFYKVGEKGEMGYALPDEMFDVIDSWCATKFLYYVLVKGTKVSKKFRASSVSALTKLTKDKFVGCTIEGVTPTGEREILMKLKGGLTGNTWVATKQRK